MIYWLPTQSPRDTGEEHPWNLFAAPPPSPSAAISTWLQRGAPWGTAWLPLPAASRSSQLFCCVPRLLFGSAYPVLYLLLLIKGRWEEWKVFVPAVIKAHAGEMMSSVFLQTSKSQSGRMPHASDSGFWGCWGSVGGEQGARTVCFILLASQQWRFAEENYCPQWLTHISIQNIQLLVGKEAGTHGSRASLAKKKWCWELYIRISCILWDRFAGRQQQQLSWGTGILFLQDEVTQGKLVMAAFAAPADLFVPTTENSNHPFSTPCSVGWHISCLRTALGPWDGVSQVKGWVLLF